MANEKMKLEEIFKEMTTTAFMEALGTARPKYKGLSHRELALMMGLSESQYTHLMDKALPRKFAERLQENILKHLENGDSVEFPHSFNVFVHESEVRTNVHGNPIKKVSVRTRKAFKEKLNQ